MPTLTHARSDARSRAGRPPVAIAAAALATLLLCAACSKPEPPETDRPPEPQAAQGADRQSAAAADATELRDAIQQPIDRAKAVDAQVQDAAAKQQAAVDAQSGY
jgi:hypothetical protein